MTDNRGPTKRSRFEVPISSRKPPRQPPRDRRVVRKHYQQDGDGTNRALLSAGIVVLATLMTTLLLLAISGQIRDTTAANLIAQSPGPLSGGVITLQPTPQPSLMIATPSVQPNRAAASPSPETAAPAGTPDDTEVQAAIDKKLGDDASLSQLGITATVNEGKVILVGTAPSQEMKDKVEKLVRAVKGVKQIDNQIAVISQ